MEPKEIFNLILNDYVTPGLKKQGWKRNNSNFFAKVNNNICLVEFQKNRYNTRENFSFTINLAVSIDYINKYFKHDFSTQKLPHSWQCHWSERIGICIYDDDYWWEITSATNYNDMGSDIIIDLLKVLPKTVYKFSDDQVLKQLWSTGFSNGLFDHSRLMNLAVLYKRDNEYDFLNKTLLELELLVKGRSLESVVKNFIEELMV